MFDSPISAALSPNLKHFISCRKFAEEEVVNTSQQIPIVKPFQPLRFVQNVYKQALGA